ncbi:hypothetical protein XENOCAPTIV_009919 [Xenoophorus captivus]|uniref:Uncharacterized protein n=1 Tax=Xenoophorus captivus TaxID=1517983 RepID=A0ABV0QD17_9TELE
MNFIEQSTETPLSLTPQFDAHKSQTPASSAASYKKIPGLFLNNEDRKERDKKLPRQKEGERKHYELGMSDELFRELVRPDCTKKCQFRAFGHCQRFALLLKPRLLDKHLLIYNLLGTQQVCSKRNPNIKHAI